MTKKSMVQVVIGGKVLTMGGYDDETHIQRIASCVNRVMRQMEDADEYRCLPADLKPIFIHINIADELVTAQELIDQLEQELQASAEANIKGDTAAIITHDTRFHELIIDAADNEYIAEISHMLVLHIQRIRYHFFHLPTMRRISASQHRGILDALRERDAQRAKTLMREHWLTSMNGSLKDTMESLRQAKASGPDETES